jgi:hypothetical protein
VASAMFSNPRTSSENNSELSGNLHSASAISASLANGQRPNLVRGTTGVNSVECGTGVSTTACA